MEATQGAVFNGLNPIFALLVPIVSNWTRENLNPELFAAIWIELGECASNAGERVDLESVKCFDWERLIFC